jgi:hypothetical protein
MSQVSREAGADATSGKDHRVADNAEPTGAEKMFGDFAPGLVHFTDDVLFGEVWKRPQLSPKERSLITVAALITGGNAEQLTYHLQFGQGQRRDRGGADRGHHPPGVLRGVAEGHLRDVRRQASLRQQLSCR